MWKSSHDVLITRHQTKYSHYAPVSLLLDNCSILLVNIYARMTYVVNCYLLTCLISLTLLKIFCVMLNNGLMFFGDWNCDFKRCTVHYDTSRKFWSCFDIVLLSTLHITMVKTLYIRPMRTSLIDRGL